jgi:predicted HTH domain antitoxin
LTHQLTIEYDAALLAALNLSRAEFDREARFMMAAKFYELGKLSSGNAAKLCGMERVEFLMALHRIGVNFSNLTEEDAEQELNFDRP